MVRASPGIPWRSPARDKYYFWSVISSSLSSSRTILRALFLAAFLAMIACFLMRLLACSSIMASLA